MAEPESTKICPKCNQQMEEGYVLDKAYAKKLPARWIAGAPDWGGEFLGLKILPLKTGGRPNFQICTFRCMKCGYLESFAL